MAHRWYTEAPVVSGPGSIPAHIVFSFLTNQFSHHSVWNFWKHWRSMWQFGRVRAFRSFRSAARKGAIKEKSTRNS